ncbi:MAG: OmpA family protein [Gammaproteobacteria bacterium]
MKFSERIISTWLVASVLPAAVFGVEIFSAPTDVDTWKLNQTRLECRLEQGIEHYGAAVFTQQYAQKIHFKLYYYQQLENHTPARLTIMGPPWNSQIAPKEIGEFTLLPGRETLELNTLNTQKILSALKNGLVPEFNYKNSINEVVKVRLSGLDFRQDYQKFLTCVAQLLPIPFTAVEYSVGYFKSNGIELSPSMQEQLQKVRDYVLADPEVVKISIWGYSDNSGRQGLNNHLSKRRAENARDYLIRKGVPADLIKITWRGERDPVADNATAEGRAKNRRVVVRIVR